MCKTALSFVGYGLQSFQFLQMLASYADTASPEQLTSLAGLSQTPTEIKVCSATVE